MTEIGRRNITPPFVPNLTKSNQPPINYAQYSVQPNTTTAQPEPLNRDLVSLMVDQIAISKPNPIFTVPANHVSQNLSAWVFLTTGCSEPHVAISQSALQGLSRAPSADGDNNAIVPQVVPVRSCGTVH